MRWSLRLTIPAFVVFTVLLPTTSAGAGESGCRNVLVACETGTLVDQTSVAATAPVSEVVEPAAEPVLEIGALSEVSTNALLGVEGDTSEPIGALGTGELASAAPLRSASLPSEQRISALSAPAPEAVDATPAASEPALPAPTATPQPAAAGANPGVESPGPEDQVGVSGEVPGAAGSFGQVGQEPDLPASPGGGSFGFSAVEDLGTQGPASELAFTGVLAGILPAALALLGVGIVLAVARRKIPITTSDEAKKRG